MTDDEVPQIPTVHVEGGAIDGHSMPLSQGTGLIVGSGRLAHLRLDHPQIELAHVKITWDDLGIAMTDNGSRYGTWVNGEKVESAALIDGDVITFTPPDSKDPAPRVRMRIPKGSVAEPPPPAPEESLLMPQEPSRAAPRKGKGKRRARKRRALDFLPDFDLDFRMIGLVVGGLAVLAVVGWLAARFLSGGGAPSLSGIQPTSSEPGQAVTIAGARFDPDAAANTVWFADRSVPAESVSSAGVVVTVPVGLAPGKVSVSVETARGRSGSVSFGVLPTLIATALEPAGALPGDPVELQGQGFDGANPAVTVGGVPANVVGATPTAVRFEMPAIEGAPGTFHAVEATVGGRKTAPLQIALGRLPLVTSLTPSQAQAGELVKVAGLGFPEKPGQVEVRFGPERALVVTAVPSELTVVAPLVPGTTPQTVVAVSVKVGDRTSSGDVRFPIVRLASGTYVMHFFAAAGAPGVAGSASLATEMGPVLFLGGPQAALRAVQAARALNEILARPQTSGPPTFEAQEKPETGVGPTGAPALLLQTTPQDAAVYAAVRGGEAKEPFAIAAWWAALLNDYIVVGTGPDAPRSVAALDAGAGRAFADLRKALPFQYRSGVSNERVAGLPERVRARQREVAISVP